MIRAHFEGNRMIINLSEIDNKYLWKTITFTLCYGVELLNWENEYYSDQWKTQFLYEGQSETYIEINDIKEWYRGAALFIWYYLKADFWSKFLIFRDNKDIEIQWRESEVYNIENLNIQSWIYRNHKDEKSIFDILKNLWKIAKILIFIWVIWFVLSVLHAIFVLKAFTILPFFILVFTFITYKVSIGKYISVEINVKNIETELDVKNVIIWKATRNVKNIEIQLFWINHEKGHYEVDSWSTTRTVYIDKEVGNILLFTTNIASIDKWEKLEDYIRGKIDMNKIYNNLFPSLEIEDWMWLFTSLELRIISKELKDIIIKKPLIINSDNFAKKKNKTRYTESRDNSNEILNSDFFE
jgi:hypothetical protein